MIMLRTYWHLALRNKWIIAGSIALSLGLAWVYCMVAPKYYQSETLIIAEERKGIENVIDRGDVEGNFDQRLFLIQRQIVNQDFLGEIAKEFGLFDEGLDAEGEALALQELSGRTKIERVKTDLGSSAGGRSTIEAFMVSFMHRDSGTAMQVTARIADKFIEENNREREREVKGAAEFLDEELRWMKRELEKKEENISLFKKAHVGDLPQQAESNLRALDRAQADITSSTESLQRHSEKLAMLEQTLHEYRASGQRSAAVVTTRSMEPDPLFRRLKELREKLVTLKAEFWDGYPEVMVTKEEIRNIEEQLKESYGPDAIRPDKMAHDPYVQDLMKLQGDERGEMSLVKRRLELLHANARDLEKRLERTPRVEQELLVLERDYNNMKANYAMLLDKRLHARVAENMEKRQKGGKFRILDHANFPRTPVIPNRPRVLVLGFLFGCVFGASLSVLRERLTPQFRGPEDVELLLAGPRLLAAIPDFSSLWRVGKEWPYLQSQYLLRRPLGRAARSASEIVPSDQPVEKRSSLREIDKRFVAKLFPRSMVAEQYRVAAARLQLLNSKGAPLVAAVTSAIKGEGKTTTIINLGYTLARDFGKQVLLLECDFVYPELAAFMKTSPRHGLVDCLKNDIPLTEAMCAFPDVPCWIMPAGESVSDSNELLRAGQLDRVLSRLREQFDYVLLNAPPILPVATMNVLERYSDLLLLVVRANVTSKQAVTQALGSLRASKPIHVILNGVAANALPNYMADYSTVVGRVPVY
jgi:polysaccharide chain length determinant protein (PEP-CTERM system associated)